MSAPSIHDSPFTCGRSTPPQSAPGARLRRGSKAKRASASLPSQRACTVCVPCAAPRATPIGPMPKSGKSPSKAGRSPFAPVRARVEGISELVSRTRSRGFTTSSSRPSSPTARPTSPAATETPATARVPSWAVGRKASRNSGHFSAGGGTAAAPNSMVKETMERWICASPEKSGPHRCRSAPRSALIVWLPKKSNVYWTPMST